MSAFTFGALFTEHHYVAGEVAPSGWYRDLESGRLIQLKLEEPLPQGRDGLPTYYACIEFTWQPTNSDSRVQATLP